MPLAFAVRDQGNDVLVASLSGGEIIEPTGLHFANVEPGLDWRKELRRAGASLRPDLLKRTVETNSADREAFVPLAALVNDAAADGMVRLATQWRPDLIVFEYLFPAGLLAAARLGIPAVQHDLGFVRTPGLRELMLAEMAPAFARHDIAPIDVATIDIAPPSMIIGEHYGRPMRPVPYNGGGPLPKDLVTTPDRPRIAVTLGTVPPKVDGLTRIDRVITAAAHVDAEFILVMGDIDIAELGELPANVRPFGWVPWDALLRTCTAAIHHGGSGTTLTALATGIPQLLLPDGSDRFINAEAVHTRGAGRTAATPDITPALLDSLLNDPGLRKAAAEVSAEIAAMPAPATVAASLG